MKQILIILLLTLSTSLLAQIGEVPVVNHNGVECYEHTVKKKQTAYGISRMYKVDINKLFEINPSAEQGLNIGSKIYLPTGNEIKKVEDKVSSTAQTQTAESIQEEGASSTEIIHTVKEGETLWSIARKYGVKAPDVLDANLEKGNNLSIGDKIKIPISNAVKKDETTPIATVPTNPLENPGDSIILHKVQAGETMYGISSKYGVSQQAILSANDNLTDGLKKGIKIRIPLKRKVVLAPETINLSVTKNVDSLTEQISAIAILDTTSTRIKEVYDVAILLPFYLEENKRRKEKCPPFGECLTYSKTFRALNFHHGIMMAIDSLQNAGMNLNVHVYDTENNEEVINKILSKPELKKMDLILGPIYVKEIKLVSKFAKANKIQMICPVPVSNKALYQNPYVSKLTASKYTQVEYLAKYLAKTHNAENVILVRNKYNKSDEVLFKLFKRTFAQELLAYPNRKIDSARIAASVGTSSKLVYVQNQMVAERKNIIVDLSTDLGHVSNLFTKLASTMNANPYSRYEVELFGMEAWKNFETIDEKYKNRFHLNIITPGHVDFKTEESIEFISKYRTRYGTDPDRFAFIGFDAAFTNLKGLFLYGSEFAKHYDLLLTKGNFTTSNYKASEIGSGYENKNVKIIHYDNYELKKIN